MKIIRKAVMGVLAGALLASGGGAWADEGWKIKAGPALWGAGVDGDIGVGTMDADLDITFGDILSNVSVALQGRVDAIKGPWRLYADGLYAKIDAGGSITPTTVGPFNVGNQTFGPFSPTARFDFEQDVIIVEAGAAYHVGEWPLSSAGEGGAKTVALDVLAGVRYTNYETEVDFKNGTAVTVKEDWIDPYVGGELAFGLSSKWDLVMHLDVGGFGVGSDFTYNAVGGLAYEWSDKRRAFFGYRGLYQDYDDGSGASRFKWDATAHGPLAGMEFRF